MLKKTAVILIGIFLSLWGEEKGLQCPVLPKMPRMEHLNARVMSSQMAGAILFGGFRGMIVDLTWMYIDNLWHHGRFYALPSLYDFVTTVQPEYINGWVMGGWHMAYNMSLEVPQVKNLTPQLRKKIELDWVYRGIDFLKAGADLNPENAELYFEIGWTYFHRLKDYRSCVPWFEESVRHEGAMWTTWRPGSKR